MHLAIINFAGAKSFEIAKYLSSFIVPQLIINLNKQIMWVIKIKIKNLAFD
jgi:hypothetical protein